MTRVMPTLALILCSTAFGTASAQTSGQVNMVEVERFVSEVYLDDGNRGTVTTPFADKVLYYGRARSRAAVLTDKQAYYARWPQRSYTLTPDTLRVAPSTVTSGGMDLNFEYTFSLSSSARQTQGRGRARLTVVRDGDGIAIAREDGEVIR